MKKIKSIGIFSLLLIIVILLFTIVFLFLKKPDEEYVFIGGVIRNTGNGWVLLDNEGHEPLNIINVETTNGAIIIYYSDYDKVITFSVTPDETMAAEGYSMGASVGLNKAIISVFDKDHNLINPNNYSNSSGNIWISGTFKNINTQ